MPKWNMNYEDNTPKLWPLTLSNPFLVTSFLVNIYNFTFEKKRTTKFAAYKSLLDQ